MDYSSLVAAVALDPVGSAILGIAELWMAVKVVVWGAKKVLAFLGRDLDDPNDFRNYH